MRKTRQRVTRRLGERYGAWLIRQLSRRAEKTELDRAVRDEAEQQGGCLLAVWHGRGAVAASFFDVGRAAVLVSASDDGKVAATILGRLGYRIVWGSSSRGGVRALREMIGVLRGGKHVAITPDGPRGPMHAVSPGLAFLSRATGRPILPVGFACDRAWHFDSWDHYTVPKVGARLVACYMPTVEVPRDADEAALAAASEEVRRRLRDGERRAAAHLGLEPDWVEWTGEEAPVYRGEPAG